MNRQRRIVKKGNSYFIALSMYDMKDFGLVEGDIVDIDDLSLMEEAELIKVKRKLKK